MNQPPSDAGFPILRSLWEGLLSGLVGLVWWNWKKLNDRVEGKLDRAEWKEWKDDQQAQHRANTRRLDAILLHMGVSLNDDD